jgi:hypothetical protein
LTKTTGVSAPPASAGGAAAGSQWNLLDVDLGLPLGLSARVRPLTTVPWGDGAVTSDLTTAVAKSIKVIWVRVAS